MNREELLNAVSAIRKIMVRNAGHLAELDGRYGDGDLGITMKQGFDAIKNYIENSSEKDLGLLLRGCSGEFNEAAPSTLGTIMSFILIGMAKELKGKEDANLGEVAGAMEAGINLVMEKAQSAPGDKTILDSICPAVNVLKENAQNNKGDAFQKAYEAAALGVEETKAMKAKHGRIAYYGDQSIGSIDAGAEAGMLIFKALAKLYAN